MNKTIALLLPLAVAACADFEPRVGPIEAVEDGAECGSTDETDSGYGSSPTPCLSSEAVEYGSDAHVLDAGPYK
jgi:hypothetical protein